ncbi:RNA polymerase sigma-70 factor (ECF subfamily) [Algoriphagus sp. 4150]|uniref:sigma-70 family RNA polymerase sigma factor n=1 Tax=Algoriphagus sp. 4150 TaxID=2817756 RepID=UPI00285F847F|nr:sigma-70 family RNA polymerase sigma factor [Algoriphagus sp. 4150]MDR7130916.1 RNA polymerase sigma-70 factor (ECF subfamily) [Algoriphagus sp. 4150]
MTDKNLLIGSIVTEFYVFLKAYVLRKCKNEQDAEDIVQEVMLKLTESYRKGTEIANIKAWLFQVSRNTISDFYKRNNHEYKEEVKVFDLPSDDPCELTAYDYLIPMIGFLPEKYAEPLLLADIDRIPQAQIAREVGLSISATKMRIQRGRVKLKELFDDCCDIDYDQQGNFVSCSVKITCTPLQNHLSSFQKSIC